jgi:hypothetical protein
MIIDSSALVAILRDEPEAMTLCEGDRSRIPPPHLSRQFRGVGNCY